MGQDAPYQVKLTREQMEERRLLAGADLLAGMKHADVARKYGVSPAAVSKWDKIIRAEGIEGLRMHKAPGKTPKLTEQEKERLKEILIEGPLAHGWETDIWTSRRVKEVIQKEFGVEYHLHHVPKLLHKLGFRPVKPKRQAAEKDEEKKEEWLKTTWVEVKKTNFRGYSSFYRRIGLHLYTLCRQNMGT